MIREGSGEPLVLLHGILGSELRWTRVVPLLAPEFDTIATTALGHRGGLEPWERPLTVPQLVDGAERQLDELGLDRPHLAGNSLGSWIALELARRGRARSVCALCPAGFWDEEEHRVERDRVFRLLLDARRDARRGRHVAPQLARSKRFRRWAMRDACVHGDRLTREEFVETLLDTNACDVAEELIKPGTNLEPLPDPSCPITIAWGEHDAFFPPEVYRERGEELFPTARVVVLEGVGHVPMSDDPELIADTIRDAARAPAPA